MKITYKLLAGLITILVLQTAIVFAQETKEEEQKPPIVVITKAHANYDYTEGTMKDWLSLEKEYFEKVTTKNEYLAGTSVMMHLFSEDASEVLLISIYNDWVSIEKAAERDGELAKEAWPDAEARSDFFSRQAKYYTAMHSDEIYQALQGAKFIDEEERGETHVYYFQVSHLAFPEDSEPGEIQKLRKEYLENVIYKNEYILGYYPMRHLYGADSRDFVEVFVVKTFGDVEKALDEMGKLSKEHWPDDDERKEFYTKYNKYFTGWHADYLYTNIPELSK
jgi:hypothetical protein